MAASRKKSPKGKSKGKRGKLAPRKEARGLTASEIAMPLDDPDVAGLAKQVLDAGGAPIGAYRDPLGGRALVIATLPLDAVLPTPFQRDLSPAHTKRLAEKIGETEAFLDPLIVVRGLDGALWTPNGRHRLAAAKVLGLRQITALVARDDTLAYRILALNTEKAHNLKDKSLEAIRMARSLARTTGDSKESEFAAQFEAPEHLTLGIIYEKNGRFGGGAYAAFLKKVDRFLDRPLKRTLQERADFASRLEQIDAQVKRIVTDLQKKGFKSPYLRSYVVARLNPVRFHRPKKGDTRPAMPFAAALTRMAASARKFDVTSVSSRDLAWMAAGASSGGDSEG
jgi:ParB family transcriptional regulator, chromosome partitioning protein